MPFIRHPYVDVLSIEHSVVRCFQIFICLALHSITYGLSQTTANIWVSSGTCEQKCLPSHLQVTFREEACSFHSGSDKTWNPHSEAMSWWGDFSQWVCDHGQSCQMIPLMSHKSHTQSHGGPTDVILVLHRGITTCVSHCHDWPHTEPFKPPGQTVVGSGPCESILTPFL